MHKCAIFCHKVPVCHHPVLYQNGRSFTTWWWQHFSFLRLISITQVLMGSHPTPTGALNTGVYKSLSIHLSNRLDCDQGVINNEDDGLMILPAVSCGDRSCADESLTLTWMMCDTSDGAWVGPPQDWIDWLSSVLRPRQHSIGYMGDCFYRSKDPTNSIKVLKEQIVHRQIKHTISRHEHKTQQVS